MFSENTPDFLEIAFRRDHDAAGTHHRLGEKGGNGVRIFGEDQSFQLVGTAPGEVTLALPVLTFIVEAGRGGMFDELQRQTEPVLRVGKCRHAGGGYRDAVVTAPSADDFSFLRLAAGD